MIMPPTRKESKNLDMIGVKQRIRPWRPGLTHRTFEMDGHQWTQITFGIFVWIIVAGKALAWIVFDWSDVLYVSRIFTLA